MRSHRKRNPDFESPSALRASVTFPAALYHSLEALAQEKRVSLAWIVRDAAERYVAGRQKATSKTRIAR